jgi:hypothetical protein
MDVGKVLDKRNTFRSRNWSQTESEDERDAE